MRLQSCSLAEGRTAQTRKSGALASTPPALPPSSPAPRGRPAPRPRSARSLGVQQVELLRALLVGQLQLGFLLRHRLLHAAQQVRYLERSAPSAAAPPSVTPSGRGGSKGPLCWHFRRDSACRVCDVLSHKIEIGVLGGLLTKYFPQKQPWQIYKDAVQFYKIRDNTLLAHWCACILYWAFPQHAKGSNLRTFPVRPMH